jgi:hypothetical protein
MRRILLLTLVLMNVSAVWLLPPLPSSFYGTVKVSGVNVPLDTQVSGSISGVTYAHRVVQPYGADTVYSLDVPGDDPQVPGKQGGVPGDTVVFHIGDLVADQTAPWQSGTNVQLGLTTFSIPVTLTVQISPPAQTAGNSSSISVTVQDQYGLPVADGTRVRLTTDMGYVLTTTFTTAGIGLSTISSTIAGTAHVTATSWLAQGTAAATFMPGPVSKINLLVNPATLTVNKGGSATLTAWVADAYDNPMPDVTLSGETSPATLGSVTGLSMTTESGQTFGTWEAGIRAGTGTVNAGNGSITATAAITLNNPLPAITTLSPVTITAGSPTFTLAIVGEDLVSDSQVLWNGTLRPTTFVSGTQIQGSIGAGDVSLTGTFSVTVFNPAPGGGTSNTLAFAVVERARCIVYLPVIFRMP